jgi:hypothetical protein
MLRVATELKQKRDRIEAKERKNCEISERDLKNLLDI